MLKKLKYFLFGLWYPVFYENYYDVSYSKAGVPSHSIYWVNLKTGKHKTIHYFNKGFMKADLFSMMQDIIKNKTG